MSLTKHSAMRWPAFAAGSTLLLAASALAGTAPTDTFVGQKLASHPTSGWSSVIVKTNGDLTAAQEAQVKSLGGDIYRRLSLIQSVGVRVPSRSLARLASLPFVAHVSLDGEVRKTDTFTVGSSEANLATGMANGKPYQLTGQGVTVAVLDSGIAPVPDLAGSGLLNYRIAASVNFVNDDTGSGPGYNSGLGLSLLSGSSGKGTGLGVTVLGKNLWLGGGNDGKIYDPCGHGTHVAGIIAGNGASSSGLGCFRTFYGIAPQSNLVNVRVLDQNGETAVSTVITGLQWVVANKNQFNIRVINLSLGHPVGESYQTDPLCQAVEAAYKAGIVVVCAAGNNGRLSAVNKAGQGNEGWGAAYGSINSPANDPYVLRAYLSRPACLNVM